MEELNSERIIGSCLEINSDITRMKFEESRLPRFFTNLRANYYRKKLIKTVKKLNKANIALSRENIIELLSYVFSNFPPTGTYDIISKTYHVVKNDGNIDIWSCNVIVSPNRAYHISIDNIEKQFEVTIIDNENNKGTRSYSIRLTKLDTTNKNLNHYIKELNESLIKVIMNYTLSVIENSDNLERKSL